MIAKPDSVRIATQADERPLYDLLMDLWTYGEERGLGWPVDPILVLRHIEEGTRPNLATRSDPMDLRRAVHGVIDDPDTPDRIIASVGLFIDQVGWYTREMGVHELWFYVRGHARNSRHHERALRDFAFWVRQELNKGTPQPMPLISGFYYRGPRLAAMERLWQRLWGPTAEKVAALWWIE